MRKLLAFLLPIALALSLTACTPCDDEVRSAKPVIYLYPEEKQDETCDAKPVAYLYPKTRDEQNRQKEQPTNKANGNQKSLGHLKGAKTIAR